MTLDVLGLPTVLFEKSVVDNKLENPVYHLAHQPNGRNFLDHLHAVVQPVLPDSSDIIPAISSDRDA